MGSGCVQLVECRGDASHVSVLRFDGSCVRDSSLHLHPFLLPLFLCQVHPPGAVDGGEETTGRIHRVQALRLMEEVEGERALSVSLSQTLVLFTHQLPCAGAPPPLSPVIAIPPAGAE